MKMRMRNVGTLREDAPVWRYATCCNNVPSRNECGMGLAARGRACHDTYRDKPNTLTGATATIPMGSETERRNAVSCHTHGS